MDVNIKLSEHPVRQRRRILIGGQVQGVGFRPFVYRTAHHNGLTGHVVNTPQGVEIEIQGAVHALENFFDDLQNKLPPLAVVHTCVQEILPFTALVKNEHAFSIRRSIEGGGIHEKQAVLISPDVGLCHACRQDMHAKGNIRHNYAFTNCTNCGPRYSITRSIPYDRDSTSMACFPLCPQCFAEYSNPLDRRFHAQPNACPLCGPRLWCVDMREHTVASTASTQYEFAAAHMQDIAAIQFVAKSLRQGALVAMKGLGGFHLCCDATDKESIARLRRIKSRPHKPLALMVPHMDMAKRFVHIHHAEEALLCSAQKPIVLCKRKKAHDGQAFFVPHSVAPDSDYIGIMLPYTPLHEVLFHYYADLLGADALAALIMTSGNAGGEPICLGNREALERLAPMADVFLLHNRDIVVRVDDSVCMVQPKICSASLSLSVEETPVFLRRARGFVPRPVLLPCGTEAPPVLGMGAELKSTLCLTRGNAAFVSQHVGTLENAETLHFYEEVAQHLERLLEVQPRLLVHDLHPNFLSTQKVHDLVAERGIAHSALQHHVAHTYAVLAEYEKNVLCEGKALGISLDGMGLGEDGTMWGGELLLVDTQTLEHKRLGRLSPFALPGGDKAVQEPWRCAVSLAHTLSVDHGHSFADGIFAYLQHFQNNQACLSAVQEMLQRGIHCPQTSSVGRLFDAVSAALGVCQSISYEGQAAIRLEEIQKNIAWTEHCMRVRHCTSCEPTRKGQLWEVSAANLFRKAVEEGRHKNKKDLAARYFHIRLAQAFTHMAQRAAEEHGVFTVALSGGVLQNSTLRSLLVHMLQEKGLRTLTPRALPSHDGAISLGQAYWGVCSFYR